MLQRSNSESGDQAWLFAAHAVGIFAADIEGVLFNSGSAPNASAWWRLAGLLGDFFQADAFDRGLAVPKKSRAID